MSENRPPADSDPAEGSADPRAGDMPAVAHGASPPDTARPGKVPQWPIGSENPADALLGCLLAVAKIFERPTSGEALTAGLPVPDSGLDPDLFIRAAERIDLSAGLVKRDLDGIPDLVLPCVLLLKDRQACVFVRRLASGRCELIFPETTRGRTELSADDLAARYIGHALFVRPMVTAVARDYDEGESTTARHWFWGTIGRFWRTYVQVGLAAALINLFALATPIFTMSVYDRVVPNLATETLWVLAIGVAIVYIFDFTIRSLRGYFIDATGRSADVLLASRIFQQVLGTKLAARPQSTGSFAAELREFESLRDFMTSITMAAVVDLPFVVLFIAAIWWVAGWVALVPLAAVPMVVAVGLLIQIPLNNVIKRNLRESAQKHAILVEAIGGIETIKSARGESRMQRRYETFVGKSAETAMWSRTLSAVAVNFSIFAQNLVTVGVVIVGVYLIMNGQLTVGGLVACSMLAGRAIAPLGQVAGLLARFQQSKASFQTLNRIMAAPVERPPGANFLSRPRLHGEIEFRKVTFGYPGQTVPTLDTVSFRVTPGERVAILGRIGSGKTTIEKLVAGFFEPQSGTILMDGVDIRQIDPVDLRRNVGCVLQEVHLFSGTARENIVLSLPHADDSQILAASQIAGCDEWISRHPQGYDLPVGEGGNRLSGGQRQTIGIARAILPDPPILLLDEPTSHMDHASEVRFRLRFEPYIKGKTVLLVTHRSSLLSLVDRIIVIDNGRVVADGPREQVVQALSQGKIRAAQ